MPRRKLANAAIALAVLSFPAVTGCGGDDEPELIKVTGSITVTGVVDLTAYSAKKPCKISADGFRDVETGATIETTDAAGKTLAIGTLESAEYAGSVLDGCVYSFGIPGVPDGETIYKFKSAIGSRCQFREPRSRSRSS